jgi:hypothetical protein
MENGKMRIMCYRLAYSIAMYVLLVSLCFMQLISVELEYSTMC